MKPLHLFLLDMIMAAAAVLTINSCAYSIPNGGAAVLADVAEGGIPVSASDGTMRMTAFPASGTSKADAAAKKSQAFWGN